MILSYLQGDLLAESQGLIDILSNTNLKMSELLKSIPKYSSTPEVRLDCVDDNQKNNIVIKIKKYFLENYTCDTVDGVRIMFEHGWSLIRSSNTQPAIVLRIVVLPIPDGPVNIMFGSLF